VSARSRVEDGAKLLDEHAPDWYQIIDKKRLALASCEDCVGGQLCEAALRNTLKLTGFRRRRYSGVFSQFCNWMGKVSGIGYYNFDASEYGFDTHEGERYTTLDRYWKEEINLRLKRDAEVS
jgi:hypothetical protein